MRSQVGPKGYQSEAPEKRKRRVGFLYGDDEFYDRLGRKGRNAQSVQLSGKSLGWPSKPQYLLDHASPIERADYVRLIQGCE